MICYLLNKYNANKTIDLTEDNLDGLIGSVLDPKNRVTIETLHDPDGPLNTPDEEKNWFDRWDENWGKGKEGNTKIHF